MVAVFSESEAVILIADGATGRIDLVRENVDALTDRPTGETSYDITWDDGEYSTHLESELVAFAE